MVILAAEWRGVLSRSWNSERSLAFAPVVITKTLGICRAKDTRAQITRRMELWERGLHAGLVGDAKAEGVARDGRATSGGEEEDEAVTSSYHDMVLSGNIRQATLKATNREGRNCLLPDDQCTKTGRPVPEVLRKKHPYMCVSPVENPTCAAFKEYEEVPKTLPLDFTEDDVTWVASNLSGTAGALGAEAVDLRNWLLRFGCLPEELRVDVARQA